MSTTGVIKGTIKLLNTNGSILDILCQPPGKGQGFHAGSVTATSVNHHPVLQARGTVNSTSCVEAAYEVEVEACTPDGSGIAYVVTVHMGMDSGAEDYLFQSKTSDRVKPLQTVVVDFHDECAGMLDIAWVDEDDNPDAVNGGSVRAYREKAGVRWDQQAVRWSIANGTEGEFLIVRGDERFDVDILYDKGTDPYSDKIRASWKTQVDVARDTIVKVVCKTSDLPVGRIVGQVDVIGKEEHFLGSFTRVRAYAGPFGNIRYHTIATTPSSGAFQLENLVASEGQGYAVFAEMRFGLGRRFQAFQTPVLGIGNAMVPVHAGSTTDLGSTLVVNPGVVRGDIVLAGPRSSAERTGACLEDIYRPSDTPGGVPGIPKSPVLYGFSSGVLASGVDSRAGTAQFSAGGGSAMVLFEGELDPDTGRFEGDYELALGGLNLEPSLWTPNTLHLFLRDTDTPQDPESYQDSTVVIVNDKIGAKEVVPEGIVEVPQHYCFGQVYVCLYSITGKFYRPQIHPSKGSYEGEDFEGNPARYNVDLGSLEYAYGTPVDSRSASNLGMVVLCLPEGKYDLDPWVVYDTPTGTSTTQLPPVTLEVRCGEVQKICNVIWIELDNPIPAADSAESVTVSGRVHSDINVTELKVIIETDGPKEGQGGDAEEVVVCTDCGPNPEFRVPLKRPKGESTVRVVAKTAIDGVGASLAELTRLNYFKRGDSNADDKLDISDAEHMLGYFYKGGGAPSCLDAADANDDGALNVTDAVFLLLHLFQGGLPIPAPFGECGPSHTENGLSCISYGPCE